MFSLIYILFILKGLTFLARAAVRAFFDLRQTNFNFLRIFEVIEIKKMINHKGLHKVPLSL